METPTELAEILEEVMHTIIRLDLDYSLTLKMARLQTPEVFSRLRRAVEKAWPDEDADAMTEMLLVQLSKSLNE